jgi:hypothetical protein
VKKKLNLNTPRLSKRKTFIDLVAQLEKPLVDPKADLKKLYYESKGDISDAEIEFIKAGINKKSFKNIT